MRLSLTWTLNHNTGLHKNPIDFTGVRNSRYKLTKDKYTEHLSGNQLFHFQPSLLHLYENIFCPSVLSDEKKGLVLSVERMLYVLQMNFHPTTELSSNVVYLEVWKLKGKLSIQHGCRHYVHCFSPYVTLHETVWSILIIY